MKTTTLLKRCGICGEQDIPVLGIQWLWWKNGKPIHPWCDRAMWVRISFVGKHRIRRMVDKLLNDAAR